MLKSVPPIMFPTTKRSFDDPLLPLWKRAWDKLHPALAAVLHDHGLQHGDYADACFFASNYYVTPEVKQAWKDAAAAYLPVKKNRKDQDPLELIDKEIENLVIAAKRNPPFDQLSEIGRSRLAEPRPELTKYTKLDIPPPALLKWRALKPPDLVGIAKQGTSIRALEAELANRWRARILARIVPHAGHPGYSRIREAMTASDSDRDLHRLFGTKRWTTLSHHGRNLDNILTIRPGILPFTNETISDLFDRLEKTATDPDKKSSSAKPATFWKTIQYILQTFAPKWHDEVDIPMLKNKRDATRAAMITTVERLDKRALAPSVDCAKALEKASNEASLWLDRWFSSMCRHGYGTSGRFNDYQHSVDELTEHTQTCSRCCGMAD